MIKKVFSKDVNKLHLMNSIQGLGWSMVGIFIPIYLLALEFSLSEVFTFYLIQNTVILLTSFLVVYLGRVISIKKILLLRFPFLFLFLFLLYRLPTNNFPIYPLAIIDGIQVMLYWMPLHILFSQFSGKEGMASSTGKLFAIPKLLSMFGPLIGGIITVTLGFKALFIVAATLFVLAYIPILLTKTMPVEYNFNLKEGPQLCRKYKKYFYSEICNNIGEEVEEVIWPIFVYLSLVSVLSVGYVGSLLAITSALFTLIIGRLADKKSKVKMIKASALLIFATWILRYFLNDEIALYALTVLAGMAFVVFSVPYYSIFYQISQKEKTAVFFAFREVPVWIARMTVFGLGIVFADNLPLLFLLAGVVYTFFLFWKNYNNQELAAQN